MLSETEYDIVTKLAEKEKEQQLWLGGEDSTGEGEWGWVDRDKWGFTDWRDGEVPEVSSTHRKLALYMSTHTKEWRRYNSYAKFPFLCKAAPVAMTGASSQAWEYRAGELQAGRISITWRYHFPGHQVLEAWQDRRRTGFTVQWFVKDKEGRKVEVKGTIANEELWKSDIDIR